MDKLDLPRLRETLCRSLCGEVAITQRSDDRLFISTPFTFDDGDTFTIIAEPLPGGVRLTDCGETLMHLSYSADVNAITGGGNRGEIFRRILADADAKCDDGEIYLETTYETIGLGVFRIGQAITRVHDISFLNQVRVASTFYEDLSRELTSIIPRTKIEPDYVMPAHKNAEKYMIDFKIESRDPAIPVFLFGIPNDDKAKLTTIILQHWLGQKVEFDSLVVFADQSKIGRDDLARLTDVAGEMISSLDAKADMKRKLERKVLLATSPA
jgi:hypothetical protein